MKNVSSTDVVGEKRSPPVATDTSNVDNFAGRGERAAGLKLEQAQKRNKKLCDGEADDRTVFIPSTKKLWVGVTDKPEGGDQNTEQERNGN